MNESELSLGLEFGVWGVHQIEDGIVTLFIPQAPKHSVGLNCVVLMSQIKGRVILCLVVESTRRILFQSSLNNVPSPIYCYSLALGGGVSVNYLTALRYFVQRVQGSRLYFPGDLIF